MLEPTPPATTGGASVARGSHEVAKPVQVGTQPVGGHQGVRVVGPEHLSQTPRSLSCLAPRDTRRPRCAMARWEC